MKRILILMAVTLSAFAFIKKENDTAIKIVYVNSFTDLKNNDLTDQMAPDFGRENHYFINDKNYKAYNESNKLLYLYNSATNIYYSFTMQGSTGEATDASTGGAKKAQVKALSSKETICGYVCSAVEVTTKDNITVYYYNSAVSIDKTKYAKHNLGDWNKCLDATNGALPLKMVYTDKKMGYIWTSIAREVTNVTLKAADFAVPGDFNKSYGKESQ